MADAVRLGQSRLADYRENAEGGLRSSVFRDEIETALSYTGTCPTEGSSAAFDPAGGRLGNG